MNDTLFFQLIVHWIPYKYLPIDVNRQCSEKIGIKRRAQVQRCIYLYADIYTHVGSPCGRYCICKLFTVQDKINAYYSIL